MTLYLTHIDKHNSYIRNKSANWSKITLDKTVKAFHQPGTCHPPFVLARPSQCLGYKVYE